MMRYQEYLDLGWSVVVVGDMKSDVSEWHNFCSSAIHFLSFAQQEKMYPKLSLLLGANTYARKNIGYLFAISHGADIIYETDDDTFLRFPLVSPLDQLAESKAFLVQDPNGFYNPYNHFAKGSGLWPRGYPLSRVGKDRWQHPLDLIEKEIDPGSTPPLTPPDIIQTLVNLEPDVDAIYRLVIDSKPIDFEFMNDLIFLESGTFSPGNTQSTFWLKRRSFEFLYIPRYIDFRFCDILKMYIAQSNLNLAYAGFFTEQFRNQHSFIEDFRSEISCYLETERLVQVLNSVDFPETIYEIYETLNMIHITSDTELPILETFLEEYHAITES
jgi:hypothetical protein